jgi:hypothetical protein
MAKPAKRRIEGDASSSTTTSKRVTPKGSKGPGGSDSNSGRYTPPRTGGSKAPSPQWVPILMFGLWGVGLLVIILNYMGVLPGSADGGNGWYLVGGLAAILAGIMVATQYR